jgi:membrane protease YdiL (CAAX protease family)
LFAPHGRLSNKELLLTGRSSGCAALALQLALRVSIVVCSRIPESLGSTPGSWDFTAQDRSWLSQVAIYLLLTYGIVAASWGTMIVLGLSGGSVGVGRVTLTPAGLLLLFVGGMSPSVSGLFLTGWFEGRAGLRTLWRRATHLRLDLWGALVVFLVPSLASAGSTVLAHLRGAPVDLESVRLSLGAAIGFVIVLFVNGPLSEEFGWRGFALDRLLVQLGPIQASVALGIAWVMWHVPLFFIPGTTQHGWANPAVALVSFGLRIVALSVLMTWVYLRTARSIGSVVMFHFTANVAASVAFRVVGDSSVARWSAAVVYVVVALLVLPSMSRPEFPSGPPIGRMREDAS